MSEGDESSESAPESQTLWHGRFGAGPADELLAFTASLSFDQRLAVDDLAGSHAHVRMLGRVKLITDAEMQTILDALETVQTELAERTFVFAPTDEDIHTAIERRVTELAGDAGAKLHTGRSRNDQVRFEVGVRALAPELEVLAPVRVWGITREDCIAYAAKHDIPIQQSKEKLYSIDDNLVGRAIECGEMEDPWARPPADIWALTADVADAPTVRRVVVVRFEQGVPVSIDGDALPMHELVGRLTGLAGAYGYGRLDMVENRRVGIKSRETYEAPGALALITAHGDLESITVERDLAREKARLEPRYGELV
jgi:hypothetical protein